MNLEQQQQHFEQFVQKMEQTMLKKADDYSNKDRLSSFKSSGEISGKTPEEVCLILITIKVARLGNLIGNDKNAKNESISDTLLDLANYAVLCDQILTEKADKDDLPL